jgi:hypothetical protein
MKDNVFPTGIATGGGLTKREYLAGQLMKGMLSGAFSNSTFLNTHLDGEYKAHRKDIVKLSLDYADALLEALDKPVKD